MNVSRTCPEEHSRHRSYKCPPLLVNVSQRFKITCTVSHLLIIESPKHGANLTLDGLKYKE